MWKNFDWRLKSFCRSLKVRIGWSSGFVLVFKIPFVCPVLSGCFSRCRCPTFCAAATSPGARPGRCCARCWGSTPAPSVQWLGTTPTLQVLPQGREVRFLIYSKKQAARKARGNTQEIRQRQGKTSSSLFLSLSSPGTTVTADGWVVLGRDGVANFNLQEQNLLVNKKEAEKELNAGDEPEEASWQMMYHGIGTPQWIGNNGNQGIGGKWAQRQEDQSLGEMLEELREGSQKYKN